jgi:protein TonB
MKMRDYSWVLRLQGSPMKLIAAVTIMIAWYSFLNNEPQTPPVAEKQSLAELEKRAVADVQRIPASEIDAELPRLPFANWFRQVVGPRAGVVWQLSECIKSESAPPNSTSDMSACVEVNTILPDERKVIVMITVGTFNRGMIGAPAFQLGVIERSDELYTITRLRDLPKLLSEPEILANVASVKLPEVNLPKVKLTTNYAPADLSRPRNDRELGQPIAIEAPPPPQQPTPEPPTQQKEAPSKESPEPPGEGLKILGSVTWGGVISKAQPRYPPSARRFNASGPVDVLVTISEAGRVTAAKATSGHPLLRAAAEEAARQWVFKPATLKGVPVESQIVLTFVFQVPR